MQRHAIALFQYLLFLKSLSPHTALTIDLFIYLFICLLFILKKTEC